MIVSLQRETLSPNVPTIGMVVINGEHVADSLELPWLNNQRRVSCILAGTYELGYFQSVRFGRPMIHVTGVPGRRGILIHPGNQADDSLGCILLGKRHSPTSLIESRDAVEYVTAKVRAALAVDGVAWLDIKNPGVA